MGSIDICLGSWCRIRVWFVCHVGAVGVRNGILLFASGVHAFKKKKQYSCKMVLEPLCLFVVCAKE